MRRLCVACLVSLALALPVKAAPLGSIAAVVNGEMITSFDLQNEVAGEAARMGLNLKSPESASRMETLSVKILDRMINNIVLTQEAKRLSISVTEGEIDAEQRQFMERGKLSPDEFKRQLQVQRLTEKEFRERIRGTLLRNRLLSTMVGRKVIVSKEEIAAYYNEHKNSLRKDQHVRFAVIVYPPTVDAEKLSARLITGKASFEQTAKAVSIGPRGSDGGDVGNVNWNELDPVWRDRLSALQPGEVSPLFDVNGMKGQLKLLSMQSGEPQTLDEATPQIESILREPKLQERFQEYNEQLRKKAVVEIRR